MEWGKEEWYCRSESFDLVKVYNTMEAQETKPAVQCSWLSVIIFTSTYLLSILSYHNTQ